MVRDRGSDKERRRMTAMNKLLRGSLMALALWCVPAQVYAWDCCGGDPNCKGAKGWCLGPITIDFGCNWYYRFGWGCHTTCGGCQAGPWYSYWPYEAHFATPAPVGGCFPYWPSPLTAGGGPNFSAGPVAHQMVPPAQTQQGNYLPAGYFQQTPN